MQVHSFMDRVRVDRLISLAIYRRYRAMHSDTKARRIPILMYHSVSPDVDRHRHPYYRVVTTPGTFARQMEYLHRRGYEVVSLERAASRLKRRDSTLGHRGDAASTGSRIVALTFDDGFRDFHTHAFPVLREFGFKATVFLATNFIGGTFPTGRECLGTSDIEQLSSEGIDFGSHTASHPQLQKLSAHLRLREMSESRLAIERITERSVRTFSYPYRFPEENVALMQELRAELASTGYTAGVTTTIGRAAESDDPLFLKRLPVNDLDDDVLFEAKLVGAYDWLHGGQLLLKKLRAGLSPVQTVSAR